MPGPVAGQPHGAELGPGRPRTMSGSCSSRDPARALGVRREVKVCVGPGGGAAQQDCAPGHQKLVCGAQARAAGHTAQPGRQQLVRAWRSRATDGTRVPKQGPWCQSPR